MVCVCHWHSTETSQHCTPCGCQCNFVVVVVVICLFVCFPHNQDGYVKMYLPVKIVNSAVILTCWLSVARTAMVL